MNHYQKIQDAIGYILKHQKQQPSLDEIAASVHLSPFHFQRVFNEWAGISPKQFLQTLTLADAKQRIKHSQTSLLNISSDVGLSSSSRLYDHFVTLNAVTPSEFKALGQGLTINYAFHVTDVGSIFIAVTERGICKIAFTDEEHDHNLLIQLQQDWPNANIHSSKEKTKPIIDAMFNQQRSLDKPLSLLVKGTNFQVQVWQALLKIPFAEVVSYSDIAKIIGNPNAVRAVGSAIGKNPIAFYIPCHRVLQKSGELGGYRWGVQRKYALLLKEAAMRNP